MQEGKLQHRQSAKGSSDSWCELACTESFSGLGLEVCWGLDGCTVYKFSQRDFGYDMSALLLAECYKVPKGMMSEAKGQSFHSLSGPSMAMLNCQRG